MDLKVKVLIANNLKVYYFQSDYGKYKISATYEENGKLFINIQISLYKSIILNKYFKKQKSDLLFKQFLVNTFAYIIYTRKT